MAEKARTANFSANNEKYRCLAMILRHFMAEKARTANFSANNDNRWTNQLLYSLRMRAG